MLNLANQEVLVIGLGPRGRAACSLLLRSGARVTAVDERDTPELRQVAQELTQAGLRAALGATAVPDRPFAIGVISPGVPLSSSVARSALTRDLPLISEIELGSERVHCLQIAIAGTNGKSTTAGLIEQMLASTQRKTLIAGDQSRPVCGVVEQSKDLDFLILQVESFQLERTDKFHPAVAILTNLAPDHLDRYASAAEYALASARLFRNQQPFDWAVIQSEAMEHLRELNAAIPAKVITFSASSPQADLHLDRGLIISRLPNWNGPLLDLDHCQLPGPHNAENLMAALATGHALRLPLETMLDPLKSYKAGQHRFEPVAQIERVQFINDSKAENVDALSKALAATRPANRGEPNVLLIAGGRDKGLDFHSVGPVLSKRVKHVFLIGEAAEKIRAAWSLFTPCTVLTSLVEAVTEAAKNAVAGDVVLLSPACSSFDQFRDYKHRGETFCRAVKSISRGDSDETPNINGTNLKS
jgi:UDP-N-acetylmuramoylalanine--D-glutamate ligase